MTRWFFAEGASGSFFDPYVLLANPGGAAATVAAMYLLTDGSTLAKPYIVAPRSRLTIFMD